MPTIAQKEISELRKRKSHLEAQLKHATTNRNKQKHKREHERRKQLKANSIYQLIPVFIAVLVVVIYCAFQDVMWQGAIDYADVSQNVVAARQSDFVARYASYKEAGVGKEDERIQGTINVDDQKLLELFQTDALGATERKAYGMLACYKTMTEVGFTAEQAIPLMACAKHEGNPGLVQFSWPQSGTITQAAASAGIHTSVQANNPLYIDSGTKARALLDIQQSNGGMGIGTAQWTGSRCATYLELLLELYGDTVYTDAMLYAADMEMYKRELEGNYSRLLPKLQERNEDFEAMMCYSYAYYEAGFGYYENVQRSGKDPDKVESWGEYYGVDSRNYKRLKSRYDYALTLRQQMREVAE